MGCKGSEHKYVGFVSNYRNCMFSNNIVARPHNMGTFIRLLISMSIYACPLFLY